MIILPIRPTLSPWSIICKSAILHIHKRKNWKGISWQSHRVAPKYCNKKLLKTRGVHTNRQRADSERFRVLIVNQEVVWARLAAYLLQGRKQYHSQQRKKYRRQYGILNLSYLPINHLLPHCTRQWTCKVQTSCNNLSAKVGIALPMWLEVMSLKSCPKLINRVRTLRHRSHRESQRKIRQGNRQDRINK